MNVVYTAINQQLNGQTVEGININDEQVRTLRVLFELVRLNPKEILELGQDPKEMAISRSGRYYIAEPTAEEIKKAENDKEERSILLQSASGDLTKNLENGGVKKETSKFRRLFLRRERDSNPRYSLTRMTV